MTNESGSSALSTPPRTADAEPTDAPGTPAADETAPSATAIGALWLGILALVWLTVMLRSVQASLTSPGDGAFGITAAAIGLPAVVSAALVGGAGVALAVRGFVRRSLDERPTARFVIALGSGLLVGMGAAAAIVLGHPDGGSAVMVLGGTIAAGATIGAALAGIRATAVVGAGVAASLGVFLLTFLRELFKSDLLRIFGAGDNPVSMLNAQHWLGLTGAVLSGLVAGLIAVAYLRRAVRHAAAPPRWPVYLLAGASTGLMLLLTEAITRIGGAQVLALARSVSDHDSVFQDMADAARINAGLLVLFVGGITAIIAFGRTLTPAAADEPAEEPATP
ncbi:hypothetical protein SAMN05444365_103199 [Micromonospora pattaloongensis]|uniref:Uncharacterized protein n=1 Tax=Micromonospora pattaloongensis TaxID=405436 RepID=A0A1H3M1Z0_9ACTN|nr:hypothetical protein [Micromonospora pattaloongensis]SDY70721.1 hypothetical protein SAMN05444365_103199 [Micromonospora pattaloongensis]